MGMNLSNLALGQHARIIKVNGTGAFRKRILEMGFVQGQHVEKLGSAPMGDPSWFRVMGYEVTLRKAEAELVDIELCGDESAAQSASKVQMPAAEPIPADPVERRAGKPTKRFRVALVGNPNCGKTSIFNQASGAREKVGNYSGVTIDARGAHLQYGDYDIELLDLPGTYSLTAYSPEELYVRKYLLEEKPDVVLNVVDSSNLERNLYLTLQLLEIGSPMVISLNMWDEIRKRGDKLNRLMLSDELGVPCVPTNGRTGEGMKGMLHALVQVYEGKWEQGKSVISRYSSSIWKSVNTLKDELAKLLDEPHAHYASYYSAIRLLEGDTVECKSLYSLPNGEQIKKEVEAESLRLTGEAGMDAETYVTDVRYDFIRRLLDRVYVCGPKKSKRAWKERLDKVLLHKFWGLPIFFGLMWLMFWTTFTLGAYPQDWITWLVDQLSIFLKDHMAESALRDLFVDGIIGGVGAVIVFLPQIMLLFLFISLFEDTGYMARAVFLMDRVMRAFGLHGRSFIPLVMGYGCNVPAIMATRTIEDRKVRMVTMLINPFMSCSSRLQVYLLLVAAIFVRFGATVLMGVYLLGIVVAVLVGWLFRKSLLRGNESPFVMELPPYRLPTAKSAAIHMWDKGSQYLRKMGGIILVASILVWFLGYFPRRPDIDQHGQVEAKKITAHFDKAISDATPEMAQRLTQKRDSTLQVLNEWVTEEHQRNSYLGIAGRFIEPVIYPLGFDWRIGVALIAGTAAKEVVVSTLGVLFLAGPDADDSASLALQEKVRNAVYMDGSRKGDRLFTPLTGISLMIFVIFYVPCISVIAAIRRESGSWWWAIFAISYSTVLAYILSLLVFQIGSLF